MKLLLFYNQLIYNILYKLKYLYNKLITYKILQKISSKISEKPMKTASAKQKGRKLQQEVAQKIRETLNLPEEDVRSTSMGAPGVDILFSEKALEKFPFAVECKNQEALNVWKMMEQAEANSPTFEFETTVGDKKAKITGRKLVPLGIFKRNRSKIYCTMEFDYLLMLMKELSFRKPIRGTEEF